MNNLEVDMKMQNYKVEKVQDMNKETTKLKKYKI